MMNSSSFIVHHSSLITDALLIRIAAVIHEHGLVGVHVRDRVLPHKRSRMTVQVQVVGDLRMAIPAIQGLMILVPSQIS